jgi:hypothetical protein
MTPRERAAALIRELAQQDKISGYVAGVEDDIAAAIEEAVAEEREACVQLIVDAVNWYTAEELGGVAWT